MPITPNFSTSQTLGVPESINFTDISAGSDVNIVTRHVYMQAYDGTFLVQEGTTTDYEIWDYAASTITFDVLPKDYALLITVEWLGVSGIFITSKQYTLGFTLFNETYDYQTTQNLAAKPALFNDNNFFNHKSEFRTAIDAGNQAVEFASDLYNAQLAYDKATDMRTASRYLFNTNS